MREWPPRHRDAFPRAHEHQLFARLSADRSAAARDSLVEQFMPLARKLAWRYRGVEDIEDLEQVAAMGLMKAIERFDPERGIAFSSFAFPTILGELKRHLRDHGWSVRPPRGVQELASRISRDSVVLQTELGRAATVAELAQRADGSVEQVLEALQAAAARHSVSLDRSHIHGDGFDDRDLEIASDETGFATAEDAIVLADLMRDLTSREQWVLRLRFREDLTQSEIGEIVGISQMHVSRTIHTALERLGTASHGSLARS
ncbi:sigma-70 family RNA polymerase sigma factor [Solirubrobacter ginsenosidimutans]|uniref:Sigma-70 family RNA polymerase sigma factor n=1 Tax=Solirubrobacter ginsenosidimutans TaxID=490573 RepID=A0A9X3S405_9ACTN|nr:sigma-70 family RNA polymerase sigma factor [Solirubrobacter ginsenosidimutans]MDA0160198.1 sigma-70 family RNA polymerase sigma factor [Solirubrobacter ginsenosidimutans]